jgi:hypothetical protein
MDRRSASSREAPWHFRTVTLGRDYGSDIELLGGVPDSAELVLNPSDDVIEGAHVRVIATPTRD